MTPNPTGYHGTGHTAETPGYFLLDFGHSNIILTPVIGKRNTRVFHCQSALKTFHLSASKSFHMV